MKSIRCRLDCATWCEYFMSGECTSSVKCKYQTEHISVKFPEAIFMPTKEACEKMQAEIVRLTAEVAELRARLDNAIELPSGDRVWYIAEDEEGQESYIIPKPTSLLTVEELKYEMDKKYFSTRAVAEAKIKENAQLRARLDKTVELPCAIGETVYIVIKNCAHCQHYNASWAECRAPATANFDCESTHGTCFTQDVIEDECKKHLCVAELKFDLGLLDPKTGKLLPYYFTDREVAEARLKELEEENND